MENHQTSLAMVDTVNLFSGLIIGVLTLATLIVSFTLHHSGLYSVTTLLISLLQRIGMLPVTIPYLDAVRVLKVSHVMNAIQGIIGICRMLKCLFIVVESVRMQFWDVRFAKVKTSVRNVKYPTC